MIEIRDNTITPGGLGIWLGEPTADDADEETI